MFTTDEKGAIAETAIAHAATKLGLDVYRPIAEGGRYDLIFDLDSGLARVQCKWAQRNGDVLVATERDLSPDGDPLAARADSEQSTVEDQLGDGLRVRG